ncbi:glycosyltransferase family 1 protein [Dactylosporangium siamense]|uniref:GDP-mannose-dependent alpha-(1-6)-phosphatidylinositol dimannoside mannosyltransferase n=1 Tax=Dactylosporangium siamense TaxID=685454 RepID=A0A919UEB7_9ACTN|nr:GDP-mannose-dependent alpha-(1-6)-phosphatidylinositol dimannoside mannosyltransferase [Dactylosporangium siamense]
MAQLANFYTPVSGGLRTCVSQTGRHYVAAGHDRLLVVPGTTDDDSTSPLGRQVTIRSHVLPGSGGYRVLTDAARVLAVLEDWRPDVLEVNDKLSVAWLAPWARAHRVPLVMFSHERLDEVIRVRVSRWLARPGAAVLNRRLHARVDRVVVASDFSAEEFLPFGAAKVRRVRLGVDLDVFRPSAADAVSPADPVEVRLVLVSRLSKEKSPELAVEAVRELCRRGIPVHLEVVGDGPLRARLRRRAAGLPITFAGHVPGRARLAELLASADIALSPSRAETFGLATLEALACGVPVVVPRDGAAAELITAAGAGAVTDGTPTGIADGVQALLALPAPARRAAARATAEHLPWSGTATAMLDCFTELLASADVSGPRPPRRVLRPSASESSPAARRRWSAPRRRRRTRTG